MEMIRKLQINNYKSIKKLDLNCSRINVFIGQPNVGKSNVLEALSLYSLGAIFNKKKPLSSIARAKTARDLFYFRDNKQPIQISSDFLGDITIQKLDYDNQVALVLNSLIEESKIQTYILKYEGKNSNIFFNESLKNLTRSIGISNILKKYSFKKGIRFSKGRGNIDFLQHPYGENLLDVIETNKDILEFIGQRFRDYGFHFVLDNEKNNLFIQKELVSGVVSNISYDLVADTFQRMIFYMSAIKSNDRSILILEEPEAHSFPPYVSMLADEIVKSRNQFFIATHSPYLLNNIIENTPSDELAVYVCGYDNKRYQTVAKKLTESELSELLDYGVDIFFNINRYLDDRVEHRS